MCGENACSTRVNFGPVGSPPRVRGKLGAAELKGQIERITPACAGKTNRKSHPWLDRTDHPRVCGENSSYFFTSSGDNGSPPRVRGKPSSTQGNAGELRITPACAGKTRNFRYRPAGTPDHPRVCGENQKWTTKGTLQDGSPPRVRGKPVTGRRVHRDGRITPACAGKTRDR